MIVHESFRLLAARRIDGPLTHDEEEELSGHRSGCDACHRYEAGLRADARALAVVSPLMPPATVDRRLEAMFEMRRTPPRLSPVMVVIVTALVMAAAAGATLAIGAVIRQQEEARLPLRPDTPPGWSLAVPKSRDIRVALPPYAVPFDLEGSVMANEDPSGNTTWFQVFAAAAQYLAQPSVGQRPEDWLLSQINDPNHDEVLVRDVALPAGHSVMVQTTYHASTPEETQVQMYAIATDEGYAMLQIVGRPEDFTNHRADIALIPYLLETGQLLEDAIGPDGSNGS